MTATGGHAPTADIIVCVHNALDDVQRCLASVQQETPAALHRLILINDGSDAPTTDWLRAFATGHDTTLLESGAPERYTRAANRGLRASNAPYAILLNSDTVVTPGWLEKLIACGESDPRIGILGPLSNAASYQSVPRVREGADWSTNPLPDGMSPADMARLLAELSPRAYPRIPFINGFCFALKRAVIDAIGYLDEAAFPNGYGEENDYCLRARAAGFDLAIADDAYVFHAKSRSYSHAVRAELSRDAVDTLARKYGARPMRREYHAIENFRELDALRAALATALRDCNAPPG